MKRWINNLGIDLFAVPITLNHEGRQKANSRHGFLLTVLFVGFIIWFVYTLSQELFVRKNPNTINYQSFEEVPPSVVLNKETFPFAFGLQLPIMQGLSYFKDEEIYIPDVKLIVFKITTGSDGSVIKDRELIDLDIEACTYQHFGDYWTSFTNIPLEKLYCLKPVQSKLDKILIQGVEDLTTVYSGFNIAIVKCQGPTCKSDDEVKSALTGAWVNLVYLQSAINPQNYTNPNQRFRSTWISMISPTLYKSAVGKLTHLNVVDDDNWLFETKEVKNFLQINSPTEYLDTTPDPDGFLWNGFFDLGQVVTTYERKYTKLQTVLAQIQGSAATVILGLIIILHPYSQAKFNETLINELFDVKMKKQDLDGNPGNHGKSKASTKGTIKTKDLNINGKNKGTRSQKARSRSPKNSEGNEKIEIKVADNDFRGGKEDIEAIGGSVVTSQRALLTSAGKQETRAGITANNLNTVQSFKAILYSIENETDSPRMLYDQRPRKTLEKSPKSQSAGMKKSTKGMSLAIDKPDRIKLNALSDVVSDSPDSPRKMSEISLREEKEIDSPEENKQNELMLTVPPMSPQSGFEKQGLFSFDLGEEFKEDNGEKEKEEEENGVEKVAEEETEDEDASKKYESSRVDISIWEFFTSFIKKSEKTKEKFDVLNKGMKNVRERMDILNIMKKFRELDKLKTLLLEEDQLTLFNAIPKTEIRSGETPVRASISLNNEKSHAFSQRILKKSTFIEINDKQEEIKKSYDNISMKNKKSKIDYRLLEFYNNILANK